ncbi:MAG: flagellar biosynthetic protein FliO [Nevskiaceae bacterium]|nr:MAG: flagellar biosynthetic protein FliO [Nevskiaceae bacterium]
MIFPADATATTATAAVAAAPSTAGSVAQMGFSLVLVLGVIFALAWVLRWLQGPRTAGSAALRLHAGLQVGAKEKVLLIEAGGQHLLIGVSPGGVRTLHVFAGPPAMTDTAAVPAMPPFAEKLREILQRGRGA